MIERNEFLDACAALQRLAERGWPGRKVEPAVTWHFETLSDAIDAMSDIERTFGSLAQDTRRGASFKVAGIPMRVTWDDRA